jgi:hypothetical protein
VAFGDLFVAGALEALGDARRERIVDQEPQPAAARGELALADRFGGVVQRFVDVGGF